MRNVGRLGGTHVVVNKGETDGQWSFVMPAANVIVQVVFDKSGTTAISDINADNDGMVRYFDINGRYVGTSLDHAGTASISPVMGVRRSSNNTPNYII